MRLAKLITGRITALYYLTGWLSGRKALIFFSTSIREASILHILSTCALNDSLLSISKPNMTALSTLHKVLSLSVLTEISQLSFDLSLFPVWCLIKCLMCYMNNVWYQTSDFRYLISVVWCQVLLSCQMSDFRFLISDVCCEMSDFRRLLSDVWFQMSDIRRLMSGVLFQTSVVRRLFSGVWYQTSDVSCLISDIWCQVSDIRRLFSGVWYQMSDVRCLISDVWCQRSDIRRLFSGV